MQFFTSPNDLLNWVKKQESPDLAANKIITVIGGNNEQSIVDSCEAIFGNKNIKLATETLWKIMDEGLKQIREGNMEKKMVKQAQIMRQPGQYNMPLRVCPKLPYSVGKRLISTYNCRHYCLDSIVLDDDPDRVYCAEALWRRHIMDKFAREFKDKDGKWVGGYINERFQVFHDDGGNQMQLAHGERTRKPRPHQYSTERRLEEGRGEETTDLTASSQKIIKVASVAKDENDSKIYDIFDDIVEMKQAGLNDEDIIYKTAKHYNVDIMSVADIHRVAMTQLNRNDGVVYACDSKLKKTAIGEPVKEESIFVVEIPGAQIQIKGSTTPTELETNIQVQKLGENVYKTQDNKIFSFVNPMDADKVLGSSVDAQDIVQKKTDMQEIGLMEDPQPTSATASDDFPIVER